MEKGHKEKMIITRFDNNLTNVYLKFLGRKNYIASFVRGLQKFPFRETGRPLSTISQQTRF